MGNRSSSSSRSVSPVPKGIVKINDSLYQLYKPTGSENPEVDIVFFHGLQPFDHADAYWRTWATDGKSPEKIWPQTLMAPKLPNARIMTVSYDVCPVETSTAGRDDFFLIGERLLADLVFDREAAVGGRRPVVLVGHSLGGLLIKQFLLFAKNAKGKYDNAPRYKVEYDTIKTFINNVRGIVYYSTPHKGSSIATLASRMPSASPVLLSLIERDPETARLNSEFQSWRYIRKIPVFSVYEKNKTIIIPWIWSKVIVDEASAREDSDVYYPASEDHFTICRPQDKNSSNFKHLLIFIQKSMKGEQDLI